MIRQNYRRALMSLAAVALSLAPPAAAVNPVPPTQLNGHALRLDADGKIVSWMERSTAMDRLVNEALSWADRTPAASNGLKPYYTYPVFPVRDYPHEPVTTFTRWCWAAAAHYAYSGDDRCALSLSLSFPVLSLGAFPSSHMCLSVFALS